MTNARLTLFGGIGLLAVYSLIMMATGGTAAAYAWVMLASGIALVVTAARLGAAENDGEHDE